MSLLLWLTAREVEYVTMQGIMPFESRDSVRSDGECCRLQDAGCVDHFCKVGYGKRRGSHAIPVASTVLGISDSNEV